MSRIICPALRSDDTLGFLAALGVLELCTSVAGLGARLGWECVGGAAVVEADVADLDALVAVLHAAACEIRNDGRVIPAPDATLITPPLPDKERRARKEAGENVEYDPLRLLPDQAVQMYRNAAEREEEGDLETSRWLVALVNQLAAERNGPARALTPLYSPSGRMSLHQIYRDALNDVVADDPTQLRDALQGWRREEGTGANLDARALRGGVVTAHGGAANRAVLGATWLALMAVPLFPQTGGGRHVGVVGWDAAAKGGAALRWPVWRQPLDRAAVEVLLGHPAVVRATSAPPEQGDARTRNRAVRTRRDALHALAAMGVEAVCTARRRPLSNAAGALLPPSLVSVP